MSRALTALLAALSLGACASPLDSEPTGALFEPIAGGELDRVHAEVFELFTHFEGGHVAACTATLIAPNLLLTARHCVALGTRQNIMCGLAPFDAPVSPGNVAATSAAAPNQTSSFYLARTIHVPETGNDNCGFDIALVVLESNVPAEVARPGVPRIDGRPVTGEPYVAIGYGVDATGNETAGRMLLDGLFVQCAAERCGNYGVTENEFLGAPGVCAGDSGGPALDPERRVIGVLSRGSNPCETPVYGSVSAFRDWIMEVAVEAAELGRYEPPFWSLSGVSDRPPGGPGEPCAGSGECSDGTACYYESDPLDALCTSVCSEHADCESPARCRSGFDVPGGGLCLEPRRAAEERSEEPGSQSSCAVRAPAERSPVSLAVFGLVLAALFGRRGSSSREQAFDAPEQPDRRDRNRRRG